MKCDYFPGQWEFLQAKLVTCINAQLDYVPFFGARMEKIQKTSSIIRDGICNVSAA